MKFLVRKHGFQAFLLRLPGGTERVINTKSTTVVDDIVEDLCKVKE